MKSDKDLIELIGQLAVGYTVMCGPNEDNRANIKAALTGRCVDAIEIAVDDLFDRFKDMQHG